MSPHAATVTKRREAARRAQARRRTAARRRLLLAVLGLCVLGAVVVLAMPDVKKAVKELTLPLQYQDIIRQQAAEKHLDPALVAAVIDTETKFAPRTSSAGAEGLMQIEPATAKFLAQRSGGSRFTVSDLGTPQVNIAYGTYYLRYLLDEYHQSKVEALAAYNGGETNVDHWVDAARAAGHSFGLNDIPFPETRAYVEHVLSRQREYRSSYASQLGYN